MVGDMEIQGPVTDGRHGWPFGASIENLAALGYVEEVRASLEINRPAFPVVPLPWFGVRVPQRSLAAEEKARGGGHGGHETPARGTQRRAGASGAAGAHRGRGTRGGAGGAGGN